MFLSRSPGLFNRGPTLLSAGFLYRILSPMGLVSKLSIGGSEAPSAGCWLSLPHLVSNWSGLQTNWLAVFTELYNSSTAPSSCGHHNWLIQPIHGQGYNSDIPRPDAPVIYCCIVGSIKVFHRYKPKSWQVYQRAINAFFPLKYSDTVHLYLYQCHTKKSHWVYSSGITFT